jgi:hypothetical protein
MSLRRKYVNSTLTTKTCVMCKKTYPRNDQYFYKTKHHSRKNTASYSSVCITCDNARCGEWKKNNKEKVIQKNIKYKESEIGYFKEMYYGIRRSKHGNAFASFEEFFQVWTEQKKKWGTKCPYKGYEMTRIRGVNKNGLGRKSTPTNISKDRILTNLPYSKENLMFISWEANNEKGNMGYETAKKYIQFVKERLNEVE